MIHRANSSSIRWGYLRLLLDRDRGFDTRVRVVVIDDDVLAHEIIDLLLVTRKDERWVRTRFTCELLLYLVEMVGVDVRITSRPDEVTNL